MSRAEKARLGLETWADGTLGVLKEGATYTFFAAGGGTSVTVAGVTSRLGGGVNRTVGTLDNPASSVAGPRGTIQGFKNRYEYADGGPVYRDPATGTLLLFYHAEKWLEGDYTRFNSLIGMAKSTDGGNSWRDLGEIIAPEVLIGATTQANERALDVGGGALVVVGEYFYAYFRDLSASGVINYLVVARARVADVVKAASETDAVVPWTKYYNGSWSEPGLGGRSSPLEVGNRPAGWRDVAYNGYLGRYVMVLSASADLGSTALHLIESLDGLVWSNRRTIEGALAESVYPTLLGLGEQPRTTGSQFYVYYSHAPEGRGFGHTSDAFLARRLVSCQPGLRTSTALAVELSAPSPEGSREASGRLAEAGGRPLAGAPVELAARALEGPGWFAEYTVTGTVPAGAAQAFAGFRVNMEGNRPGSADLLPL